jgi:hypothetical protein
MANNKIQIKRSATNSTVPSLSNGELAFTGNGDILYIGHPDGTTGNIRIGGKQFPGTLTANQALVANSTSGIDKLITANLTLSSFSVSTINAVANLTHLGAASNSELTTTWAIKNFVDLKVAQASNPQGTNGQFQYNDSGVLAGTPNMTFDKTANTITIGNSTVNVQLGYTGSVNALAHFHGNQNAYVQVILNNINAGNAASSDYVAENDLGTETTNFVDLGINSSTYADPNFSAMGAGDAYLYTANNDLVIGTADSSGGELRFITGGTTTSQVRATVTVGGNVGIGNTTPNARLQVTGTANISGLTTVSANLVLGAGLTANGSGGSAGHVLKSGGSGNVYWDATTATVAGSDTQVQYNDGGALAGAVGFTYSKTTNNVAIANTLHIPVNNAFGNVTTGGSLANSTTFAIGNSSVNSIHTSSLLRITNATETMNVTALGVAVGISVVNTTQIAVGSNNFINATAMDIGNTVVTSTLLTLGGQINANGGVGSAGQALISAGAANTYWATIGNGTVTSVASGNGITGGTITSSGTLYVTEGVGLAVNTTGVHVKANSGIIANSTGTFVAANTTGGLLANSTLQVKIGTGLVFDGSGNVAVNAASLSFTDLTVSGNLTVLGDLVSLNVATLAVEDPLIVLAKDQSNTTTYTDAVDIGFFGSYGNTLTKNWSGLFRDQSDSGIYKLFSGNIPEPTTTVDTTNVNFSYATLQTYLRTGGAGATGLISNATHIAITANSTLNVAIAANTLTLTTPLATTSGGTGLNSFAVGDLLVGNSSNALTRLASGADGYVLQINGTGVVAWNTLDGGTF